MPQSLAQTWRLHPSFFEGKSFRQLIQMAGDGRLRDGNTTSAELREWLSAVPLGVLRQCVEECLGAPFDEGAQALQDAANELGVRLGFEVIHGRYRGTKGEVGNDGLWKSQDGYGLLIEVKTTDAYRINLDTIARYRDELIAAGKLTANQSSILITVGRQETGDLEAQIRGSRHAWDIRLLSLEALLRLAEVKEELSDWSTSTKINQLLRPVEYTRLDGIVELLFATKRDLEASESELAPPAEVPAAIPVSPVAKPNLEKAREEAIRQIEGELKLSFHRRGRALRSTPDTRLVCLVSQRYEGPSGAGNYWYGFTLPHREFVSDCKHGWVALACADSGRVFLVPWSEFGGWLPNTWTTPSDPRTDNEVRHWHLYFNDFGSRVELLRSGGGVLTDLLPYLVQVGSK